MSRRHVEVDGNHSELRRTAVFLPATLRAKTYALAGKTTGLSARWYIRPAFARPDWLTSSAHGRQRPANGQPSWAGLDAWRPPLSACDKLGMDEIYVASEETITPPHGATFEIRPRCWKTTGSPSKLGDSH